MGRPAGSGERSWREALRRALHELRDDPDNPGKQQKSLYLIARRVVTEAIAGDSSAYKEIGDRIDGKAPQYIEAALSDSGEITDFELARRVAFILTQAERQETRH